MVQSLGTRPIQTVRGVNGGLTRIAPVIAGSTSVAADRAAAEASADAAAASAVTAASSATAAQTAETNAETAETNAETAQAAAQAAQVAAEAARDDAVDISNIDTSDAVVSALVEGTAGAGPLTRAALSTSYDIRRDYGSWFDTSVARETLEPTTVYYNPASTVQNDVPTSTAWEDIDATNLAISFVCPPSGKVKVKLSAAVQVPSGGWGVYWALRDTASSRIVASTVVVITSGANSINATSVTREVIVATNGSGAALVPGRLYTFVWQHRTNGATPTAYTVYGGTGVNGGALMEVTPLSNRVTTKTVTAAVETAPNWQVFDIDADNLHMVGQAGAGQPSILGRLGYSSNAGSSWTALPNLLTPTSASYAWFAGDGEILVTAGVSTGAPGKIYKSSGWATDPATCTFSEVLEANNVGGTDTVYFANYAGIHQYGGICVVNEYGPKTSTEMARHVYVTEDHGDTWRSIFDLRAFILTQNPSWDGNDGHTHGSAYDPWWDAVWVVTGDYDGAGTDAYTLVSFDWRSDSPTWHVVYTRHQFTSVIPMPGCILFGTDMGSSAADGIGNGLLRLRRSHPTRVTAGPQVLEGAYIYDTTSGITVIGLSHSRSKHNPDAPTLIALGESGASGPTGRIVATYDGFTFKELWTATDTGTTGSLGQIVQVGSTITAPYQSSLDTFRESKVTLTLS